MRLATGVVQSTLQWCWLFWGWLVAVRPLSHDWLHRLLCHCWHWRQFWYCVCLTQMRPWRVLAFWAVQLQAAARPRQRWRVNVAQPVARWRPGFCLRQLWQGQRQRFCRSLLLVQVQALLRWLEQWLQRVQAWQMQVRRVQAAQLQQVLVVALAGRALRAGCRGQLQSHRPCLAAQQMWKAIRRVAAHQAAAAGQLLPLSPARLRQSAAGGRGGAVQCCLAARRVRQQVAKPRLRCRWCRKNGRWKMPCP